MECYICHTLVERHEYPLHVGSHLAGNVTNMRPQPDPSLAAFSCDTVNYDHHGVGFPVHSTPPPLRARNDPPLYLATSDDELEPSQLGHILAELSSGNHRQGYLDLSHFTPVVDGTLQQGTPEAPEPNAFHIWLKNPTNNFPQYTTIDGQKSGPNLQTQFTQAAEDLRCTTREEVVKIVKRFEGLACSEKTTCLELVQKVPIFPGLVAYTYTHLVSCPRSGWLSRDDWSGRISDLKRMVDSWTESGDIQCILSCNSIRNRLLEVLRDTKVRHEEHRCNSALLNGTMMLNSDILNLAALVVLCITGPQKKDILDQNGAQAEVLVELFHNLLEASVALGEEYRRHFLNPLIQFSKDSGYCPRGVYLKEGTINGLVSESQGGFGFVYKGTIGSRLVAVKALKRDIHISLPEYNKQVSKEAIVWRHLRHPNCLPLYGVYRMPTEGPNISVALVSPWMSQGTLIKYLEYNPQANRTQLILDMVRGLDYLHSMQPHVAHRDIKPDNILITGKGRACLADFGLVSAFDADDHFHTAPSQIVMGGTCNYMAPEIFNAESKEARRKVNKRACDVYALGCTIYAAYTGKHPFHWMSAIQIRVNVISNKRPEFPKDKVSPDMWSFIENLWGSHPLKRLTAKQALSWMETKARREGVDSSLAQFEEEWEWKGPYDDGCLWSVASK